MYQIFLQKLNVRSGSATVSQPPAFLKTQPTGSLRPTPDIRNQTNNCSQMSLCICVVVVTCTFFQLIPTKLRWPEPKSYKPLRAHTESKNADQFRAIAVEGCERGVNKVSSTFLSCTFAIVLILVIFFPKFNNE